MEVDGTTVLVGAALLFAAFVKGTVGMGFPLIATPMVTLLLDIRTAVTILLIPNILMDTTQVFRGTFPREIFRRFIWLLFSTLVGVFLGTQALINLPLWFLNLSLGIVILVFVAFSLLRFEQSISPRLEAWLSPPVGFVGGFLNGMTNAAGPVYAMYLYSLKLSKAEFVKSNASIFFIAKITQLIAVSRWNLFTAETIKLSLGLTLFILVGFLAGLKTQDRVNPIVFNRGILILLFLIGVMLVVRSL